MYTRGMLTAENGGYYLLWCMTFNILQYTHSTREKENAVSRTYTYRACYGHV